MASPNFTGVGKGIMALHKEAAQAEWLPSAGGSTMVDVIFVEHFQNTDNFGVPYGAPNPVAWSLKEQMPTPKAGDQLVINGTTYKMKQIEPDSLEMNKLILSK